jgi:hypothetical protein
LLRAAAPRSAYGHARGAIPGRLAGGLATLRRYRTNWYSLLALRRWGRITDEDLAQARVVGHGLPIKDDVA